MAGVFSGELLFGGEVDLGAVGGHADVVNGDVFVGEFALADFDSGCVFDAHVEMERGCR